VKHCTVCHNDAHVNGGLSLSNFDAARADAGVAAMLVSKITSGITPEQIVAGRHDPDMVALVERRVMTGAMMAAGVKPPDAATQGALVTALSAEAGGANQWLVQRPDSLTITASAVREVASHIHAGDTDSYRLTLSCGRDWHDGTIMLAWAPGVPEVGREISVAVDGGATFIYKIKAGEKEFKGTMGTMGVGAALLPIRDVPAQTLTVGNLFPKETVEFSFGEFNQNDRGEFALCIGAGGR